MAQVVATIATLQPYILPCNLTFHLVTLQVVATISTDEHALLAGVQSALLHRPRDVANDYPGKFLLGNTHAEYREQLGPATGAHLLTPGSVRFRPTFPRYEVGPLHR